MKSLKQFLEAKKVDREEDEDETLSHEKGESDSEESGEGDDDEVSTLIKKNSEKRKKDVR
mgnify:CR=1 FL=1